MRVYAYAELSLRGLFQQKYGFILAKVKVIGVKGQIAKVKVVGVKGQIHISPRSFGRFSPNSVSVFRPTLDVSLRGLFQQRSRSLGSKVKYAYPHVLGLIFIELGRCVCCLTLELP
jgi:hypothetical protein